jgi:tetratricopeptide (TPR) repeat protein
MGMDPRSSFRRAIADQTEALHLQPHFVLAFNQRGIAYSSLGDAERTGGGDPRPAFLKAVEDFQAALKRSPDFDLALSNLGTTYLRLADLDRFLGRDESVWLEKALACRDKVVRVNPSWWEGHAERGAVLEQLGRTDEAIRSYEKALALARSQPRPLMEALARLRKSTSEEIDPTRIGYHLDRADAAFDRGDYLAAAVLFERVLKGLKGSGLSPARKGRLAKAHFRMARIRAQASIGKENPAAAPKSIPLEEERKLRDRALFHLRQAFTLGWEDFKQARKEPDLASLHSLAAFKALVEEWERKREED